MAMRPVELGTKIHSAGEGQQQFSSQSNKATARYGIELEFIYIMPDGLLEVVLRPKSSTSGQIEYGFPWFSSVLKQMLGSYTNSTLHCMLHMQPYQCGNKNFAII
jgi:hypothetical protein